MSLLWRRRGDLHRDQINAIQGVSINGRYLLLGPPGSGKTSILLHRGQFMRLAPNSLTNVRLLTFSRTLKEFISLSGDERFPPTLIQTIREFINSVFSALQVDPPEGDPTRDLAENNKLRADRLLQLVREKGVPLQFDALLIDEVQDLSPEEVDVFSRLSPRVMFSGDSRQKVYSSTGAIEAAKSLPSEDIFLKHHFRISPQICQVADRILLQDGYSLAEFCHYQGPTPSAPVTYGALSRDEQIDQLRSTLDVQLDTYNDPADLIGVVASKRDDCDFIVAQLQRDPRIGPLTQAFHSGVQNRAFRSGVRVCVVTLQSCKGLEFRAVHWVFADEGRYHLTPERAYTAVTRAKSSLSIYHNGSLSAFLAGALPVTSGRGLFDDDD